MSKHTPRPWKLYQDKPYVIGSDGFVVAMCSPMPGRFRNEEIGNAILIAQAPDMIGMLKRIAYEDDMTDIPEYFGIEVLKLMPEIRALIQRAEGGDGE